MKIQIYGRVKNITEAEALAVLNFFIANFTIDEIKNCSMPDNEDPITKFSIEVTSIARMLSIIQTLRSEYGTGETGRLKYGYQPDEL